MNSQVELTPEAYDQQGWQEWTQRPALTIRDLWQALQAIDQRQGNMPISVVYDAECASTPIYAVFVRLVEEPDVPVEHDDPDEPPDVTTCLLLGS